MSWLDSPPVDIITSINIIVDVLRERYTFMYPGLSHEANGEYFDYLPRPSSIYAVRQKMRYISYAIIELYRIHFPVKNFDRWADWQPYGNYRRNAPEIPDAIRAELSAVNIDPDGVLLTSPHRISDGNFVRGCYYLLNNVLLYSASGIGGQSCRSTLKEWSTDSEYDNNLPDVDITVDYGEGGLSGSAAYGYYKRSMRCEFDRRFVQDVFDIWGNQSGPELQGQWRGRYKTSIWKELLDPRKDNLDDYGEYYDLPGIKEIDFSGIQSDLIPWVEDITGDLEYYKTWGDFQYGFSISRQIDTLTELYLTADNFPPPKYKYLDLP